MNGPVTQADFWLGLMVMGVVLAVIDFTNHSIDGRRNEEITALLRRIIEVLKEGKR